MKHFAFTCFCFFLSCPTPKAQGADKTIQEIQDRLQKGQLTIATALTETAWMPLHSLPAFREVIKKNAKAEKIALANAAEPGLKITVKGTVLDKAGSPIKDALIYVYHTSAKGWYADTAAHINTYEGDFGHARLFGYLKTDWAGKFEFETIRPEGYPNSDFPAHIHILMWSANGKTLNGMPEELLFEEDTRLTPERKAQALRSGYLITKNTGAQNEVVYSYKLVAKS